MENTSSDDQVLSQIELEIRLEEMLNKNARLSWGFVKKYYKYENFYGYRSESVEEKYEEYMKATGEEWDDISSLIKHEVFGMPSSNRECRV